MEEAHTGVLMFRHLFLLAGWVLCFGTAIKASAAEFTATYTPLASAPIGLPQSWYSGAATKDGKFIYWGGHSHVPTGNNGMYQYDPATNTHKNLHPNVGGKWRWDKDADGKAIPNSGRWATLDPVADPSLYAFFGGPTITALPNRNNHQAFYLPWRNEFWVRGGTIDYYGNPYKDGGRYDLTTNRWVNVSKTAAEFNVGIFPDGTGWGVSWNAAQAVCADIRAVVLFGGAGSKAGVRLIEENPAGPEPYKLTTIAVPPIHLPVLHVRHNAVCVGDTVYYVSGYEQRSTGSVYPDPGPFWKFHVPTRAWTRLTDGPPAGYYPVLTYDSDANALVLQGGGTGGGSNALWVYDLAASQWNDLTGTTVAPKIDMHVGGFIPGFGHVYKGGRQHKADGSLIPDYGRPYLTWKLQIHRTVPLPPPEPEPTAATIPAPMECPVGCVAAAPEPTPEPPPEPEPVPVDPTKITWTKIPLPGWPNSPQGGQKHQSYEAGPGGRVYLLGGDWGGGPYVDSGRQEVYSFDPLTGDWKQEAPYCGTADNPVHWHTDEAGVVWDEKRGVFWKRLGTAYGPTDTCYPAKGSVKAAMIQFDPAAKKWIVPPGFDQTLIGFDAPGASKNAVLDTDQLVQLTNTSAKHYDLTTGKTTVYPLPATSFRFNARTALLGRGVWVMNRSEVLERYDMDTHKLTTHGPWPFGALDGWGSAMTLAVGDKLLTIWPKHAATGARYAALYDPASKVWTVLDQGEGWGNAATVAGGKIILGGGLDTVNKFVWVGTLG